MQTDEAMTREELFMNEPSNDPRYTMGRDQEETDRLIQQSRLYDDLTCRLFNDAGIRRGMKVLDIGSGAGDVSLILAELVGPHGNVVGVDSNAEILKTARARVKGEGLTNVEFLAGDARTLDVGGDFDALVGRLVLMYMANPATALQQMTQRLRPGGIVAFEEVDFLIYRSISRPNTPLMNRLAEWLLAVFERSGAHVTMGDDLYRTFVGAGLPEPVLHYEAPMGGSEAWAGYPYIANSFRSLLPLLEEFGIATAEEVDVDTLAERVRKEIVASKHPVVLAPHVTAWATLAM